MFSTNLAIHEKYDLKGSWVARSTPGHNINPKILGKDTDFKRRGRKIKVTHDTRDFLITQIIADAKFLSGQGIMDYSLLVGIHDISGPPLDPHEAKIFAEEGIPSYDGKEIYFIGIIDILQIYDINKKLERALKVYILQNNSEGVSVQGVDTYYNRFIEQMRKIFEIPEHENNIEIC